jgi:hypothetical protein
MVIPKEFQIKWSTMTTMQAMLCGERDKSIPSEGKIATGKITAERLHSCEDMFESTLMDRKPSALPKEHISFVAKPVLQHARSKPYLGQSGQEY